MTRPELDQWLRDLDGRVRHLRQAYPRDSDFWAAFERETGTLAVAQLSREDAAWMQNRIISILSAS